MYSLTSYVERLSKYYTVYGQYAGMQKSKYRLKINNDIEVSLSQDNDDVIVSVNYKLGGQNDVKDLNLFFNRLYESNIQGASEISDDASGVADDISVVAEGTGNVSSIFGGIQ